MRKSSKLGLLEALCIILIAGVAFAATANIPGIIIKSNGAKSGNSAPQFTSLSSREIPYGDMITVTLHASDPDGDYLNVHVYGTNAVFNVCYPPTNSIGHQDVLLNIAGTGGTNYVTYSVTDEYGATTVAQVPYFTVDPYGTGYIENNPIEVGPINNEIIEIEKWKSFEFLFYDTDPEPLDVHLEGPDGMTSVVKKKGLGLYFVQAYWKPRLDQIGKHLIRATAIDTYQGRKLSTIATLQVEVVGGEEGLSSPALDPVKVEEIEYGNIITVPVGATDPQGLHTQLVVNGPNVIDFQYTNMIPGRSDGFVVLSGWGMGAMENFVNITAVNEYGASTVHKVAYRTVDPYGTGYIENNPIQLSPISHQSIPADQWSVTNISATDPDPEPIEISALGPYGSYYLRTGNGPGYDSGKVAWKPLPLQKGINKVFFYARDLYSGRKNSTIGTMLLDVTW